jgi:hypothetical protein
VISFDEVEDDGVNEVFLGSEGDGDDESEGRAAAESRETGTT